MLLKVDVVHCSRSNQPLMCYPSSYQFSYRTFKLKSYYTTTTFTVCSKISKNCSACQDILKPQPKRFYIFCLPVKLAIQHQPVSKLNKLNYMIIIKIDDKVKKAPQPFLLNTTLLQCLTIVFYWVHLNLFTLMYAYWKKNL